MTEIEARLAGGLARFVAKAARRPGWVIGVVVAITLALMPYIALNLGINSDHTRIVSPDIPSQIAHREFSALFPILDDAILVVIDGDSPERARAASVALEQALERRPDLVHRLYEPGGGEFFERHGLLYRTPEELETFADHMLQMQPIIGAIEADPSLASFTRLIRQGLGNVDAAEGNADQWSKILDRINRAAVSVYSEYPVSVSWEELMLRGSALEVRTRRVLVVDPVLDFESILPARAVIEGIHELIQELELVPGRGVTVRLTGNPALNHEEMWGLAWDIGGAAVFCFGIVAFVIRRALGWWSITFAALTTLIVGLVWTAAFAAAAIGHVNLVSICFAILFIGLGVDFSIHLGMQYAHLRNQGVGHAQALDGGVRAVGSSLVLCTATTAIGFYCFVPTDYLGVAELGLVSGTGMVIILILTLTLFPALLTVWQGTDRDGGEEGSLRFASQSFHWIDQHAAWVRRSALVAAVGGACLLPFADFDPDVVKLRDPSTESVQAFADLLDQNDVSSPWFANALAPDLESAEPLRAKLKQLPEVAEIVTLTDFVPKDQEEKREILEDLAFIFEVVPVLDGTEEPTPEDQVAALRDLRDFLVAMPDLGESDLAASVDLLRAQLDQLIARIELDEDPSVALAALEEALLGRLPAQMTLLRSAFTPDPVTLDSLPADLRERMIAPDGRARIQIFPAQHLGREEALEQFALAVSGAVESPTGLAVNLVEFSRVTVESLTQALFIAVGLIATLLLILWRRVRETLLVLTPLALGAILTVATTVLVGLSFNFANIIVLPLMLGIGVDSAIHLVHRARAEQLAVGGLMGTTTARAVFFSAITTVVSFGTLTFSSHGGMASLGALLVIAMSFTLLSNLVVLPAILAAPWAQESSSQGRP